MTSRSQSCHLSLLCLGTGRGATSVYSGGVSSAFVLLHNNQPLLLVDAGFGVVRACLEQLGELPRRLLITHNHSDHASELPVILAVEKNAASPMHLITTNNIAQILKRHRLHELNSTGYAPNDLCRWTEVAPNERVTLSDGWSLRFYPASHVEPAYGFVLYDNEDKPVFAYSGDSAFVPAFYQRLWEAATVVVDAREQASQTHAGFDEVQQWLTTAPHNNVWITGYGSAEQRPQQLNALMPGQRLSLLGDQP